MGKGLYIPSNGVIIESGASGVEFHIGDNNAQITPPKSKLGSWAVNSSSSGQTRRFDLSIGQDHALPFTGKGFGRPTLVPLASPDSLVIRPLSSTQVSIANPYHREVVRLPYMLRNRIHGPNQGGESPMALPEVTETNPEIEDQRFSIHREGIGFALFDRGLDDVVSASNVSVFYKTLAEDGCYWPKLQSVSSVMYWLYRAWERTKALEADYPDRRADLRGFISGAACRLACFTDEGPQYLAYINTGNVQLLIKHYNGSVEMMPKTETPRAKSLSPGDEVVLCDNYDTSPPIGNNRVRISTKIAHSLFPVA